MLNLPMKQRRGIQSLIRKVIIMINEDTMFRLMHRIHLLLEVYEEAGEMDVDERISLKRALDVAADRWFNAD